MSFIKDASVSNLGNDLFIVTIEYQDSSIRNTTFDNEKEAMTFKNEFRDYRVYENHYHKPEVLSYEQELSRCGGGRQSNYEIDKDGFKRLKNNE